MQIRFALQKDIPDLLDLLTQVNAIHHEGRPDLFLAGTKYNDAQLEAMLSDETKPILVADNGSHVEGYAFCDLQETTDAMLVPIRTLYIDDLCVDARSRGKGIGTSLYRAAVALAKEKGCYHVTLNVWNLNPDAMRFYQSLGMQPLKVYMEEIL